MYKIVSSGVQRLSDGAFIPVDARNRDYREYLEWVRKGGVAAPEFTLDELRDQALARIKAERDKALARPVVYQGKRFWTDRDSIADVRGALVGFDMLDVLDPQERAGLQVPAQVRWKTLDGHVSLTRRELVLLCAQMSLHQQQQYAREEALIADILAATTPEELDAVQW